MKKLQIKSKAFDDDDKIPSKYTCDGEDINPPLEISNIPDDAKSLVLVVDDPDAPSGTWTHWIVFNIAADSDKIDIKEDSVPGKQGKNDFDKSGYGGPCPSDGEHRYFFKVYALKIELGHDKGASRADIMLGMKDQILAQGQLMGKYKRE